MTKHEPARPLRVSVHTVKPDPERGRYPSTVALGVGVLADGREVEFGMDWRIAQSLAALLVAEGAPVDCSVERWQVRGLAR